MGATEPKLFAVLVNGGAFYKWTFFMDFLRETPSVEGLEEARLDAIGAASD